MNLIPNQINNYQETQECVKTIQQQTNQRIYNRNVPSQPLQPYLEVRPVLTKYSYFPIVDPRKEISVRLEQRPIYNSHQVFNPGNTQSPWSGFASNINKESELRNQIYALQKCSQAVYVPNSTSDLYTYSFQPTPVYSNFENSHSLLFKKQSFEHFNPNPAPNIVGSSIFNNSTRTQIKDLTEQSSIC
jgi:hypothetical protein